VNHYLKGISVLGAAAVPGDAGVDINGANRAIRAMKPMSAAQGRRLVALLVRALQAANAYTDSFGYFAPDHSAANARRTEMARKLINIDGTIAASTLDPLPETAAQILRDEALVVVAEFNSAAEGVKTLAEARAQLWQDILDNAANLYNKASSAASSTANALKWTLYIAAGAAGVTAVTYAAVKLGALRRHPLVRAARQLRARRA